MSKETFSEKFDKNKTVQLFQGIIGEKGYGLKLVGGAVVDIMMDVKPKDWDFLGHTMVVVDEFVKAGFKFVCATKTANTYKKGSITIQFLKTAPQDFDFVISQSSYLLKSKKLTFPEISFKNKVLIPVNFEVPDKAWNSLVRIPHWKKKGFSIPDRTYFSLLNVVRSGYKNTYLNS